MRFQTARAAEPPALAAFRAFIEDSCQGAGVDDDLCHDLKLAVDEACTNVIEHGYAGMNPGSIVLTLEFESDRVTVEITDFGHPFEPYEPETPDPKAVLEDPQAGGFGLLFIYKTMDEIRYKSAEDGNQLTFVKRLAG